MRYAGFGIRFGAKILDGLILWVASMLLSMAVGFALPKTSPQVALASSVVLIILQIGIAAAYSGYFLGIHRATPGKMACGLEVVSPEADQISVMRGVGRYFAESLSSMILLIGYLMVLFDEEKRALHDRICNTEGGLQVTLTALGTATVSCSGCGMPLAGELFNSGEEFQCGNCGAKLEIEVFPALFRGAEAVMRGEELSAAGEASCFYHPQKMAATLCNTCGRFLCTLCETELAGRCLCPSCIDKGRHNEKIEQLVTRRTLHDSLALSMAILPMLFFFVTVVTAPIAIYIAIHNWKMPGSILPRSRIRYVMAIVIALAQIAVWGALLVKLAL